MGCECDYSFICRECQQNIDLENQLDYERERIQWLIDSITTLADKAGIELPDLPKERGRYR